MVQRHKYMTPPNFNSPQRKILMDDLYVMPNIVASKDTPPQNHTVPEFANLIHRTVLLADPGGGKSTLTEKLCYELAKSERSIYPSITPLLVVLREYGEEKRVHYRSILDFIALQAKLKYQVHPPEQVFEEMLKTGRLLVIFDGLDELLDSSYRRHIAADVEAFCNLYPEIPVLVTSRKVGYQEAPLDSKIFSVYSIDGFTDAQIEEYVHKWFNLGADDLSHQSEQKINTLLKEITLIPQDVKSNPLMLALICTIYQGEGYIPRNRNDVYAKCAELLFERRDRERSINYDLPFQYHIRPIIMYLANWIYGNIELENGVTQRRLIAKTTEYLLEHVLDDQEETQAAATRFVDFCKGRAWVFTDVGTTRDGESLFQFTHRTFLEYFAAGYLNRKYRDPKTLFQELQSKILKREADIVVKLAFQKVAREVDEAADSLITLLINNSQSSSVQETINLLTFGVECLDFLVPKPATVRLLVNTCLELGISFPIAEIEEIGIEEFFREHTFYDHDDFLSEILSKIPLKLSENRDVALIIFDV